MGQMMDLDPQLQNISDADLQDFAVPHYPNFDQGYQSALYDNGLAHFIADSNDSSQLAHSGPPPAHPGPNNLSITRSQSVNVRASNVNGRNINLPSATARHPRHIPQHPSQPHFHNGYSPRSTAVQSPTQLRHKSVTNASNTSPRVPQPVNRSRSQPGQPQPHPQPQSQPQPQPQPPHTPQHQRSHSQTQSQPQSQTQSQSRDLNSPADPSQFNHPSTFPLIPDPPDLAHWREKFFNIVEPLLLTSEEYHTYFPHVDNIYSHRSTQKYKKKPFVSHYWDCRLKGRPTGTPLSKLRKRQEGKDDDEDGTTMGTGPGDAAPDKTDGAGADKEVKKRKRKTRERDLCDVKIKVTEFFGRDELEALGILAGYDEGDGDEATTLNGHGNNHKNNNSGSSNRNNHHHRSAAPPIINREITFVHEDGISNNAPSIAAAAAAAGASSSSSSTTTQNRTSKGGGGDDSMPFGILEPLKKLPAGHPGADGKRWYMVQRVNGQGKDEDDVAGGGGSSLDHKHSMEESDRIKKNSVQRWLLAREKEQKKLNKRSKNNNTSEADGGDNTTTNGGSGSTTALSQTQSTSSSSPSYHASGKAQQTAKSHVSPAATGLTLYANSFCPFAQRIWIALETKGIPYQYVEVTPAQKMDGQYRHPGLLEVCPEGVIPCLRHGNWGVWESDVILEYLEDLSIGHSLLPLGDPQLRAHSRLWKDHINRKVLPYFYALLLLPATDTPTTTTTTTQAPGGGGGGGDDEDNNKPSFAEKHSLLIVTLQHSITQLVNASHVTGPFFLGSEISMVDIAFAPWIIRLSRVLEYYREFPKPEVGTRWKAWVDAIESNDAVRRTVSDDKSYHAVYGGVGKDVYAADEASALKSISEMKYARMLVGQAGFGLGGDVWGKLPHGDPVGMLPHN